MVLAARECVANDLDLAAGTILVISGPNAGGKTVALKTLGLSAVMARAGLHVPAAAESRVPWYRTIRTDIGDEQSLERNLSTFSAHLLKLGDLLEDAGRRREMGRLAAERARARFDVHRAIADLHAWCGGLEAGPLAGEIDPVVTAA